MSFNLKCAYQFWKYKAKKGLHNIYFCKKYFHQYKLFKKRRKELMHFLQLFFPNEQENKKKKEKSDKNPLLHLLKIPCWLFVYLLFYYLLCLFTFSGFSIQWSHWCSNRICHPCIGNNAGMQFWWWSYWCRSNYEQKEWWRRKWNIEFGIFRSWFKSVSTIFDILWDRNSKCPAVWSFYFGIQEK